MIFISNQNAHSKSELLTLAHAHAHAHEQAHEYRHKHRWESLMQSTTISFVRFEINLFT